jgi:hypothetical protein
MTQEIESIKPALTIDDMLRWFTDHQGATSEHADHVQSEYCSLRGGSCPCGEFHNQNCDNPDCDHSRPLCWGIRVKDSAFKITLLTEPLKSGRTRLI